MKVNTETVLPWALKAIALGVQVGAGGLTDELRAELADLVDEGKHSVLEPKADGTPWTDADILEEKARHDALTAEIRARHQAQG